MSRSTGWDLEAGRARRCMAAGRRPAMPQPPGRPGPRARLPAACRPGEFKAQRRPRERPGAAPEAGSASRRSPAPARPGRPGWPPWSQVGRRRCVRRRGHAGPAAWPAALQPNRLRSSRQVDGLDSWTPVSPWITTAMRSRVHTSVANPWASAPCSSACSIPASWSSATLGRRPVGPRLCNAVAPTACQPACQRLALCRETSSSRATSAWERPWANSSAARSRRCGGPEIPQVCAVVGCGGNHQTLCRHERQRAPPPGRAASAAAPQVALGRRRRGHRAAGGHGRLGDHAGPARAGREPVGGRPARRPRRRPPGPSPPPSARPPTTGRRTCSPTPASRTARWAGSRSGGPA